MVAAELRAADAGEVLAIRDVLCVGPLPDVPAPKLRELRADFVCRWAPRADVLADLEAVDARLATGVEEAVLWFEDDLHDQVQLAFVLERLQAGRFALVELPRQRPRALLELARVELAPEAVAAGRAAWRALGAPDPAPLERLASSASEAGELPYLPAALRRLLEEYPWLGDGLGRSERQLLQAAADGAREPKAMFEVVSAQEQRPWAGDATLWWLADGLRAGRRPLLGPGNRPTSHGEAVLAGEADWVKLRGGIDRWIAGVRLSGAEPAWRWDPSAERLVASDRGGGVG